MRVLRKKREKRKMCLSRFHFSDLGRKVHRMGIEVPLIQGSIKEKLRQFIPAIIYVLDGRYL
tara:strand:- start:22 stop:207 length:186 start_codon:yes stop_codon:yes gene_type:complete